MTEPLIEEITAPSPDYRAPIPWIMEKGESEWQTDPVWTTMDKKEIPISDLEDSHIVRILRYFRRKSLVRDKNDPWSKLAKDKDAPWSKLTWNRVSKKRVYLLVLVLEEGLDRKSISEEVESLMKDPTLVIAIRKRTKLRRAAWRLQGRGFLSASVSGKSGRVTLSLEDVERIVQRLRM